jgi:histidine triad (HIT) family protein
MEFIMADKTIFKKIIDRELPADIVYEDDLCLAFNDINPQAPVHVLVIPKQEIRSLAEVEPEHQSLLGHLLLVVRKLAEEFNLDSGFRTVINTGAEGGQTVDHLHLHLLGRRNLSWPPG